MKKMAPNYKALKSVFDRLSALLLVILTLPLMLIISILVLWNFGLPVLFLQRRPGKFGKEFVLIKFRTMLNVNPARGLISDEDRLTRFGKLLRKTSLDELPSLLNVLTGSMSFVGPRPLLVEYLEKYSPEQARRHEVLPGITGLAQVNGRNSLSWDEKFVFDIFYVNNISFWLDIRILVKTMKIVFLREGTNSPGHATMPKFQDES